MSPPPRGPMEIFVRVGQHTILCHPHPGVPWRWLYIRISTQYYVTPTQGSHGDGCTCGSAHNIMSPPPRGPMEMVAHVDQPTILCHPHPGVSWRWLYMRISTQYYVTPTQESHRDGCTCRSAHNIMSPPPRGPMEMVVHADQHTILCHTHPGVPWKWLYM